MALRTHLAVGREYFPLNHHSSRRGLCITQLGLYLHFGRTGRGVVGETAGDEDTVGRDRDRRGLYQPDVAINASAFVEPPFGLCRIDANRDQVLFTKIRHIGNVVAEAGVTALVMADKPAVHENRAVAKHAIEFQPKPTVGIGLCKIERASVPTDAVLGKGGAERLESVRAVGLCVEGKFDGPVVGQLDLAPARVAVVHAGRTIARAGLCQALANAPIIAEMEFPAKIHQQPLTWAGRRS